MKEPSITDMRKLVTRTKKAMDKAKKAGDTKAYDSHRKEWLEAYNAVYRYHQKHGQL
jgi:hypothetical protein